MTHPSAFRPVFLGDRRWTSVCLLGKPDVIVGRRSVREDRTPHIRPEQGIRQLEECERKYERYHLTAFVLFSVTHNGEATVALYSRWGFYPLACCVGKPRDKRSSLPAHTSMYDRPLRWVFFVLI